MNIIFQDDSKHTGDLCPFTLTRPVAEIRIGILTIREKWEKRLGGKGSFLTQDYLSEKYPLRVENDNLCLSSALLPDAPLVTAVQNLKPCERLTKDGQVLATRYEGEQSQWKATRSIEYAGKVEFIDALTDIFSKNDTELRKDFLLLTSDRKSAEISKTNLIIGDKSNLFVEEGATIEGAVLNCKEGPIYIGKDAEVMEQATIRGPFALCEHSTVKMSAKIYGATTIGPHCKVGGELGNVVFFGYSNKAHDGFLGNSVVGEWCNFGADTNASNLKNNYSHIKLWNYGKRGFVDTGLQFCGLFMGDHSKCGINSMFNSGTVVGICCNLFGTGYYRNYVESFSYGGPTAGYTRYRLDKVFETAKQVFARRSKEFDEKEQKILRHIWEKTEAHE